VKDWLPIAISLLGLVVAAVALWLQHRQKSEHLVVKGSMGFFTYDHGLGAPMVFIEGANRGERQVTVSSFGLKLPSGKVLIYPAAPQVVRLPHELASGKSCNLAMPAKDVAEALRAEGFSGWVRLKPQLSTQSGCVVSGTRLKFDASSSFAET